MGAGREKRAPRRAGWSLVAAAGAVLVLGAGVAAAVETTGLSTVDQRIVPVAGPGFDQLTAAAGEPILENETLADGNASRTTTRTSIAYFGQLSDFQLADEESPARVEFLDPVGGGEFNSAHRPWEAMETHVDDAMISQLNEFTPAGEAPVADGTGARPAMDFSINTGDQSDSQQLNETVLVDGLIEGEMLFPGSGVDPTGYSSPLCGGANPLPSAAEAPLYTGFQDYDDFDETRISPPGNPPDDPYFYDPDLAVQASPVFSGWPQYTGLMDRAQVPFLAEGLDAPHYASFGNHDALLQGSLGGTQVFEQVATGCLKPLTQTINGKSILLNSESITVADVLAQRANDPASMAVVPPDPNRRFVSKEQYMDIFRDATDGVNETGHGFGAVDPAVEAASAGNAGYYSLTDSNSEVPDGLRMIALDSVSEGGALDSASGNIDDPQFRWLQGELQEARDAGQLVILYSHHAPGSMSAATADEAAGPCSSLDSHNHFTEISCDIDPQVSTPLHLGPGGSTPPNTKRDIVSTLHQYPNVIGWVAGHSHTNRVESFDSGDGHGFWVVRTAAEADWPQQARLLQLFDNEDGTLSLFGAIVNHDSTIEAPAPGSAAAFTQRNLASVARTIAANDPQSGGGGTGGVDDRNVELLLDDPRLLPAEPPAPQLSSILPGATADTTSPRVVGTAELNSTVTVYETGNCTGPVDATGTAAAFGSTGIAASVADGAAATFSVTATDPFGNVSDCSNSLPFQEIASPVAQPPQQQTQIPAAKSCPKGKKLKKGKCVKKGKRKKKGGKGK